MKITVIRETVDFEKMEGLWSELLDGSASKNIFLNFDWLFTWWQHFKDEYKLFIIRVTEGEQLVGIAPLCVHLKYGFKILGFIGSDLSDYEDFILTGDIEKRKQILVSIFDFLKTSKEFDLFKLKKIKKSFVNYGGFKALSEELGSKISIQEHKEGAPYLPFEKDESLELFLKTLKAKFFADLRRRKRRLEGQGTVSFKLNIKDKNEIKGCLEELKRLHNSRRMKKGETSFLMQDKVFSFYNEVSEKFYDNDWLQINCLFCDEKIVAMHFGFVYKDVFGYLLPTFDQDYKPYAVSRLLLFELIKYSFDQNLRKFDFMIGTEEYKYKWNPKIDQLYFMTVASKSIKGVLADLFFNKLNIMLKKMRGKSW